MSEKRLTRIIETTWLDSATLAEAVEYSHAVMRWHRIDKALPSHALENARAWLVRGRRAAFLCESVSGEFSVVEYEAVKVEGEVNV